MEDVTCESTSQATGIGLSKSSRSEQQSSLFTALVAAQAAMSGAKKDQINPHFKSKYADLASVWEAIREPLTRNGLCLLQEPQRCETGILLETTLAHSSGEWRSSTFYMPVESQRMTNAQAYGSALTYARRYASMAICGIAPEDDDGQAAVTGKAPPADEKLLAHQQAAREHYTSVFQIKEALATDDYETAAQAMQELDRDTQIALWAVPPTKGGVFTTEERSKMKSSEWAAAMTLFAGNTPPSETAQ